MSVCGEREVRRGCLTKSQNQLPTCMVCISRSNHHFSAWGNTTANLSDMCPRSIVQSVLKTAYKFTIPRSHAASPTPCLSSYHTLTHTQDPSWSLLPAPSLLISSFLTNKATTSGKVCWTYTDVHAHAFTQPPLPRHLCTANKHLVVIALRHAC